MSFISYGLLIALAIALVVAAFTDIRRRQIDNWLNGAIALGAPLFWWASGLDAVARCGPATGDRAGGFCRLCGVVRAQGDGRRRCEAADRAGAVDPVGRIPCRCCS
jgi:prepilin peptidase CpaA